MSEIPHNISEANANKIDKTSEDYQNGIDNKVVSLQNAKETQNKRSLEERVDETFSGVDGKKFEKGSKIELMFMDENGKKNECVFDIDSQSIEYMGGTYKIDMPSGAKLDSVEFKNGKITLAGSVGWFSGDGSTSLSKLYSALNQVFKTGNVVIATGDGKKVEINRV